MNPEELVSLSRLVKFSDDVIRFLEIKEAAKLLDYVEILSKWSEKMSLVSSSDSTRIINEHILDCWAAFAFVPRGTIYLDIGSGSGLPGIVFSILATSSTVILVEPRAKRVDFLKEARRVLRLPNLEIVHSRLEDWSPAGEIKDNKMGVSAVERAVGMEAEIYRELKAKFDKFTLSTMVSKDWPNPLSEIPYSSSAYKLINGAEHQLVCFT